MSGKLTREQLKGLRKQNAARVAAYRTANKEKAAQYNGEYKKDNINRPEKKGK